ncbi:MAG: hypothetical protein LKE48_01955 [Solobacterium sp.]|jgi:hypothetical protein|nr:hypothetical protein [Solobacterium sp.]
MANVRSAKGAAVTAYLSSSQTSAAVYYYDADNDWYGQAVKGSSLSSLYTSQDFTGRVEKIDSSTSVMAVSDFIPRKSIPAGTIASFKEEYYVLKQTMDYSQYDSDPAQDENWASIGQ